MEECRSCRKRSASNTLPTTDRENARPIESILPNPSTDNIAIANSVTSLCLWGFDPPIRSSLLNRVNHRIPQTVLDPRIRVPPQDQRTKPAVVQAKGPDDKVEGRERFLHDILHVTHFCWLVEQAGREYGCSIRSCTVKRWNRS